MASLSVVNRVGDPQRCTPTVALLNPLRIGKCGLVGVGPSACLASCAFTCGNLFCISEKYMQSGQHARALYTLKSVRVQPSKPPLLAPGLDRRVTSNNSQVKLTGVLLRNYQDRHSSNTTSSLRVCTICIYAPLRKSVTTVTTPRGCVLTLPRKTMPFTKMQSFVPTRCSSQAHRRKWQQVHTPHAPLGDDVQLL